MFRLRLSRHCTVILVVVYPARSMKPDDACSF